MSDLHRIDGEDGHCSVHTEALQPGEQGVGPNKEGDHVSEGGHGDCHPRMLHGLTKPGTRKNI